MTYVRVLAKNAANGVVLVTALLLAEVAVSGIAYGQAGRDTLSSDSDACIAVPSPKVTSRTWKHGEAEERDFARASTTKDAKSRVEFLSAFSASYPDSDNRDLALAEKLTAEDELAGSDALASDSRKLLHSPKARQSEPKYTQ